MSVPRLLWRALRRLFHEATGALFFSFALFGVVVAWHQWNNPGARWLVWFGIAYAVMMMGFGVVAFRQAYRR